MIEYFSSSELLSTFTAFQLYAAIAIFIWTGFVRSGLGFGGAALGLPLMLMVDDSPLFWLPIVGSHLLIFTGITLFKRIKNVDWVFAKSSFKYILPAKLVGVFGLLNLPNDLLVILIYSITLLYSLLWLNNISIKSESGWKEKGLLIFGGYVSGTSLTGAPLIVSVFMQHVSKDQLRNTLFVLWFILVTIKMTTFALFSIPLQFASTLILLPGAWVGHMIGLRLHDLILQRDELFKRVIGSLLLVICIIGFSQLI